MRTNYPETIELLSSIQDSRDGEGRATQEAKAEGWGEGVKKVYALIV
jgi:hypothetical protein